MLVGARDRSYDSSGKRVSFVETWPPLSQRLLDGDWRRCRRRFDKKKSTGSFERLTKRRR
jgi:hypothetical protein